MMNDIPSNFESLSNEILIDFFSYLSASDIYRSFYDLNTRFNDLLQSLKHLPLIVNDEDSLVHLPQISTLITTTTIDFDLHPFDSVRHLIIRYPSKEFLEQLTDEKILPRLEYLFIDRILFDLSLVYQKIFSNGFPRLQWCYLFGFETIETIRPWTQSTSIRHLQMGSIDFYTYKAILSACPNLKNFKFKIFQSYLKLSSINKHWNLRKLTIESDLADCRINDQLMKMMFTGVPHLERLEISRSLPTITLLDLLPDYDWLGSIIVTLLPFLRNLQFHLHLEDHFQLIDRMSAEIRRQLRKSFFQAHRYLYETRFFLD